MYFVMKKEIHCREKMVITSSNKTISFHLHNSRSNKKIGFQVVTVDNSQIAWLANREIKVN